MQPLEKRETVQSTVGLFFATILAIPFQLLFLFLAILGLANFQATTTTLSPNGIPFLIGYFVLTIVYCAITSFLFHPKRIVSPINVQIGTAFILSLMMIWHMLETPTTTPILDIMTMAIALLVFSAILIAVGFIQFLIVRWVVGLNFEGLDRVTYAINTDFKTVANKVIDIDFLRRYGFNRKHDVGKILVYKLRWASGESIIFTLGVDSKNNSNTILATVAYQQTLDWVCEFKQASSLRDDLITVLTKRLTEINPSYTVTRVGLDDPISGRAYFHARNPTRSKVEITREFFKEIPRYYTYAIAITLLALIGLSVAFGLHLGNLDLNTYLGVATVIFIAFLTELGLSLREELSRKKIEDIEEIG
jgi:hypothetical protein